MLAKKNITTTPLCIKNIADNDNNHDDDNIFILFIITIFTTLLCNVMYDQGNTLLYAVKKIEIKRMMGTGTVYISFSENLYSGNKHLFLLGIFLLRFILKVEIFF